MARLFFALWPDAQAAKALAELSRTIAGAVRGRAVPAGNLHLTLVFLGEVEAARIASVHRAAAKVESRAFTLTLDQVGSFARAGVAWAGCARAPQPLLDLQSTLERQLEAEGFAREARRFSPHLTLARRIGEAVPLAAVTPVSWRASAIALVESGGNRGGYATLAQWSLADEEGGKAPVAR
jgi:2'-5' RNA ligase